MGLKIMIDDRLAVSALLRRDFALFLRFAYREIGGEGEYRHNWHLDAAIHQLDRVASGANRRLIITMPPRHLKSVLVTVAWVAWMLGRNPSLRFICVSYGIDLSEKLAAQCLRIIQSRWYQAAFPRLRLSRRAVGDIETSAGGGRFSTSLGGPLTGFGADYIVIDDPMKAAEIGSPVARTAAKEWLLHSLMSRLNDQEKGSIILVMQRLHEDDLVGELQQTGLWQELRLPAIATANEQIPIGDGRFYRRREGCALHPARYSPERLEAIRREIGSIIFSAQYQQDPVPAIGNVIRAEWLGTYDPSFSRLPGRIVQSWDTASKEGLANDFSVCITAHVERSTVRVLDVFRRRVAFPDLKRYAIRLARDWKAQVLLIEDAASGTQLIQTLRSEQHSRVPMPVARRPEGDKYSRMAGTSGQIEAGQLLLPPEAPWLAEFKAELLAFPNGRHDDQADAITQLMSWVLQRMDDTNDFVSPPIFINREDGYDPEYSPRHCGWD
jgi:predicted phage terminase large subunit-like protein